MRPATLFLAWAVHDVEELFTMPATSRRIAARSGMDVAVTRGEAALAIGAMGVLVGVAAWRGERSGGRDGFYQAVTAGLQAHVGTHVAASVVLRGYSTGVVTAVAVLAPQTIAARRSERAAGVLEPGIGPYLWGAAVLLPATLGAQFLARSVLSRRGRPGTLRSARRRSPGPRPGAG